MVFDKRLRDFEICDISNGERENIMVITKRQVLELVKDLPDEIDIDELMYRLYLRQNLRLQRRMYGRSTCFS